MYQKIDGNNPPGYGFPQQLPPQQVPIHNPVPPGQYPNQPKPQVPGHGPIIIDMLDLPDHPVQIRCPYCQTYTMSKTRKKCGSASAFWCVILFLFTICLWVLPAFCFCKD